MSFEPSQPAAAPIIGTYRGAPIAAWLMESNGIRYVFVGVALEAPGGTVDFSQFQRDEIVTHNGLIYRAEAATSLKKAS